jgi:hypothetical protein
VVIVFLFLWSASATAITAGRARIKFPK